MARFVGTPTSAARPSTTASVLLAIGLVACSAGDGRSLPPARDPLPTTSTTVVATLPGAALRATAPWAAAGTLPSRYACPTDVAAPAIGWSDVPDGTVELAVVVSTGGVADRALVAIEPATSALTEDALPAGSFWWPPSDVGASWGGICDPGDHRFTVYALNQQLEAADDTAVTDLVGLLALTAVGQATITGRLDVPASTAGSPP